MCTRRCCVFLVAGLTGALALLAVGAGCGSTDDGQAPGSNGTIEEAPDAAIGSQGKLSGGLDAVDLCKGDPTCTIPDVGYLVDAPPTPPKDVDQSPPPPPKPDPGDCQDWHQFGDYKVQDDNCWDPPYNYCASGASPMGTRYCKKDLSLCCQTGTTCIPCGDEWFVCSGGPCMQVPLTPYDDPRCKTPDPDLIICWDDLPDHP